MNIDWTKKITADQRLAEQIEAEVQRRVAKAVELATTIASRRVIDDVIEDLPDSEVEELTYLYPEWKPDIGVVAGQKYRRDGVLYRVLQSHTTQADWAPENVPALFVRFRAPDEIPDWVMPTGAHDAYQIGERVRHNGTVWTSKINANTTVPGSDPRWWEGEAQ